MASKLPPTYVEGFHDKAAVEAMPCRPLGGTTGLEVSILSFGGSSLGSVFRETDKQESIDTVVYAIKHGINLIDTAPWYGHGKAETVLGEALKQIPREAYILNTKVGRYLPEPEEMFDFSSERVTKSVDESLARLGVDYIDVIQVHDPEFAPFTQIIVEETLPALVELQKQGKVKMIGMTGYPLSVQKEIISRFPGKLDTILTYCHYSMNDYSLLKDLQWFKDRQLGIINASAISMGLLTHRGPPAWHPATAEVKQVCAEAAKYCESQGVNISTLAMAFTLGNPDIPTTLVSTASLPRIQKNIAACTYKLTEKEQEVSDYVMKTFFKPLNDAGREHWEGVEVREHWNTIGAKREELIEKRYSTYLRNASPIAPPP
eukprot:m.183110 g.183110  ORF g.183110 m.183110 type:complete len:375 (+) comp15720_c0_seq1:141-1265(+)